MKIEEKSAKVNSLPLVSECGSAYRCQKTSSFWFIMHGRHLSVFCVMYLVWMWLALIHWFLKAKFGAQKRTSCRLLASKTRLRQIGLSASPSLNILFILENVKVAPNLFAAPKQKMCEHCLLSTQPNDPRKKAFISDLLHFDCQNKHWLQLNLEAKWMPECCPIWIFKGKISCCVETCVWAKENKVVHLIALTPTKCTRNALEQRQQHHNKHHTHIVISPAGAICQKLEPPGQCT